jgi:hypothetical protein
VQFVGQTKRNVVDLIGNVFIVKNSIDSRCKKREEDNPKMIDTGPPRRMTRSLRGATKYSSISFPQYHTEHLISKIVLDKHHS